MRRGCTIIIKNHFYILGNSFEGVVLLLSKEIDSPANDVFKHVNVEIPVHSDSSFMLFRFTAIDNQT